MPDDALFHGIAVVIDDEINNPKASVAGIKKQIEDAGCHVVPLAAMPSDAGVSNLREVAFFVVDWNLNKEALLELAGGELGAASAILDEQNEAGIVKFLHDLKKVRFAPVFIFTDESVELVQEKLKKHAELFDPADPSHILVMDKKQVTDTGVFNVLTKWMHSAPSVYVLKSWEKSYEKAKNQLFLDFYMKSTLWPLIVWKNFEIDSVPPAALMGELIGRNLVSRMTPFECDLEPFSGQLEDIKKDVPAYEAIVRKVLEGERFLPDSRLDKGSLAPGDIFFTPDGYFINIRPDCDCIARGGDSLNSLELYLLKGAERTTTGLNFDRKHGVIPEQDNEAMVFPINGGKAISFRFRRLFTKRWREIETNRIGRLLPPHLTRLQQRYSAYLQRPGLPRLPGELFPESSASEGTETPGTAQSAKRALESEVMDGVQATLVAAEAVPMATKIVEAAPAVPPAPIPEAPANGTDTPAEIPSA
jgi:hypothetical protein